MRGAPGRDGRRRRQEVCLIELGVSRIFLVLCGGGSV